MPQNTGLDKYEFLVFNDADLYITLYNEILQLLE